MTRDSPCAATSNPDQPSLRSSMAWDGTDRFQLPGRMPHMPVAKGETIDVERTREKLLRAAAEVFYRDGTSAGVNELAQRAGVSKVSLYRHFGSKEELIEAVLRRRSDHVVAWLRDAADAPSD